MATKDKQGTVTWATDIHLMCIIYCFETCNEMNLTYYTVAICPVLQLEIAFFLWSFCKFMKIFYISYCFEDFYLFLFLDIKFKSCLFYFSYFN